MAFFFDDMAVFLIFFGGWGGRKLVFELGEIKNAIGGRIKKKRFFLGGVHRKPAFKSALKVFFGKMFLDGSKVLFGCCYLEGLF